MSIIDLPWRALVTVSKVPTCSWSAHAEAVASSVSASARSASTCCSTPRALSRWSTPMSGARAAAAERIVVGVDGSETATRALAWALDEARVRDARVRLVSAWSAPIMAYPGAMQGAEIFEKAAEEILGDAVRDADVHGLTHPIELTRRGRSGLGDHRRGSRRDARRRRLARPEQGEASSSSGQSVTRSSITRNVRSS